MAKCCQLVELLNRRHAAAHDAHGSDAATDELLKTFVRIGKEAKRELDARQLDRALKGLADYRTEEVLHGSRRDS